MGRGNRFRLQISDGAGPTTNHAFNCTINCTMSFPADYSTALSSTRGPLHRRADLTTAPDDCWGRYRPLSFRSVPSARSRSDHGGHTPPIRAALPARRPRFNSLMRQRPSTDLPRPFLTVSVSGFFSPSMTESCRPHHTGDTAP